MATMLRKRDARLARPGSCDASGLAPHADNHTIVTERIYIDKNDPDIVQDEVTVIDHALTRPWTVMKNYRRDAARYPTWSEDNCGETNNHVTIARHAERRGPADAYQERPGAAA
jgi:hypothetical protein